MMSARETCDAMADHFEDELNTSRSVYSGQAAANFDELGVVIVKPKAVQMLVNNLRMLRDLMPPDDPLVEEARQVFGNDAAAELVELRKHQRK